MAQCNLPQHRGDREVYKIRTLFHDGEMVEGCFNCTCGLTTDLYPTQKRLKVAKGTGQQFWISPAHEGDIKMRRCAPDLSHVWRDKKGLGRDMRY